MAIGVDQAAHSFGITVLSINGLLEGMGGAVSYFLRLCICCS